MKKWLLVPFIACMISPAAEAAKKKAPAKPRSSYFLSHKQFRQLTPAEQRSYLRQVKIIIADMSEAFPEMAQEMSLRSMLFAQMLGDEALAQNKQTRQTKKTQQTIEPQKPPAASETKETRKPLSDTETLSFIEGLKPHIEKYSNAIENTNTDNLSAEDKELLGKNYVQSLYFAAQAASRAYSIEDKRGQIKALQDLEPYFNKVRANEEKVKKVVDESVFRKARDEYFNTATAGELPLSVPYPISLYPYQPPKLSTSALKGSATKASAVVKAAAADTSSAVEDESGEVKYHCMYTGFVIKTEPCVPPTKVPWDLANIDEETFVCENGQRLCNPLIFGVKTTCDFEKETEAACMASAKPLCVRRGATATKSCLSASNNENGLKSALALVNNNPTAWDEYMGSFESLCGKKNILKFKSERRNERIKKDVEATCQVALTRLQEISAKWKPPEDTKAAPGTAPASDPSEVRRGTY